MDNSPIITKKALFTIGQVVRHRVFSFRGVIYDVDPEFANTEEWWESIPAEIRPEKEQPFYHILAENEESSYEAYVSQQNLLPDDSDDPIHHPDVTELFGSLTDGQYQLKSIPKH
ncbi:DNA-binding protein [Kordiimonas sediminis]|uniref:Heat shock protein HspQ n=1 Tax=Kordiimonas sediminis TaxID=1735581 RepID=A0A919AU03_9PROT|nr:heat shock protein HspQ [Kordiimonas sediminis]GHF26198.1 DNA-binding protein [Kordiimonas sediminis]